MAKFDYEGAKKAGYSDEEIDGYLSENNPSFKYDDAKKSGYSTYELSSHLNDLNKSSKIEDAYRGSGRLALHAGKGSINFNRDVLRFELAGQALKILGKGEAASGAQELDEDRLQELKRLFPSAPWENAQNVDQEKLQEAALQAGKAYDYTSPSDLINGIIEGLGINPHAENTTEMIAELLGGSKDALKHLVSKIPQNVGAKTAQVAKTVSSTNPEVPPSSFGGDGFVDSAQGFRKSIRDQLQKPHVELESRLTGQELLPESLYKTSEKALQDAAPSLKGKPLHVEVPIERFPGKSLEGRVHVQKSPELGESITYESFHSDASAGRQFSNSIKKIEEQTIQPISQAYKEAEKVTRNHYDVYPSIAEKNDQLIIDLEHIPKRNAGEEAVYKDALALRGVVGTTNGLIEANAHKLVKQADSFSKAVNYEPHYVGYKGRIKEVVHNINEGVINSLKEAGKDVSAISKADKLYADKASRFLNDEISPYLRRNIKNPEQLFNKAVKDESTYRAVKSVFRERDSAIINKLDRSVVEDRMAKYFNDPSLVGSSKYNKDLSNLSELVGKQKTGSVDKALRDKHRDFQRQQSQNKVISESGNRSTKNNKLNSLAEKISEHAKLGKPEDIIKKLNSPSGIKELKKSLSKNNFDVVTKQKMRDLLRDGNVEKTFKGEDLYRVLNKRENFEIFSEIVGKEEVEAVRKAAKKLGQDRTDLVHARNLLETATGFKFLSTISKIL